MADMSDPRFPTAPDTAAAATPTNGLDPEIPAPPADLPPGAVTSFLRGLRNIRHYDLGRPVSDEVLGDILEVARWSGSAKNVQPWSFVVVRDRTTLDTLAAQPGWVGHVNRAPLGIMLVMDGHPENASSETFDEGRLTERIMLAAAAHGLVSSIAWYWGATAATAKDLLGIPQGRLVRTLVTVGYPEPDAEDRNPAGAGGRKPLDGLVHYDRW